MALPSASKPVFIGAIEVPEHEPYHSPLLLHLYVIWANIQDNESKNN